MQFLKISARSAGIMVNNQNRAMRVLRGMAPPQVSHSCQKYSFIVCMLLFFFFYTYSIWHAVIILHVSEEAVTLQKEHTAVACKTGYLHGLHSRALLCNTTRAWRQRM